MKILHLSSDWKWTGPAAPLLGLALAQRRAGCRVELACPEPEAGAEDSLASRARAAGLPPLVELSRGRGWSWRRDRADAARLSSVVRAGDFDVFHTWHTRDHLLALRALIGRRRGVGTRIVRSYRRAEAIRPWPWNRWLFGPGTDALLCVSPGTAEKNRRLRGPRPLLGAFGAVDLERFEPRSPNPAVRRALGIGPHERVIGIVARVQRERRFDLLLEAMRRLRRQLEDARLLIIGRGTNLDSIARQPAARLGLSDRVVFAGYRQEDYPDVLRAVDVFTLLVPGSDGTCRALLEAAACGLPAVVTRRGALPEIVADGRTGLVVAEAPDALSEAWRRLLGDARRRLEMGAAAHERARQLFAPGRLAEQVADLYRARASR